MRELRKRRQGIVVTAGMNKTIMVQVNRVVEHPLYGKRQRHRKRFMAHDEGGECRVGDQVLIIESRPLSKSKRWRVSQVLSRAATV
jgi:small subunit ribosomal protein S17